MNYKRLTVLLLIAYSLFLGFSSCTKDNPPDAPANPYTGVNYNTDTTTPPATPDPNSIVGLHKNIFFPKCAKSGCHDGTFEPDYRTVQSTYATLVYQPCLKTTVDTSKHYSFRLRAWPYQVDSSFLIERLITPGPDLMPSNGNPLPASDINHIRTWIQNGCRDQNGVIPAAPDLPPYFISNSGFAQYAALKSIVPISGQLDTSRVGQLFYNSFIVPQGLSFYIAFAVTDDSTDASLFPVKQVKLSLNKDDFSAATTVNASVYFAPYWVATIPNTYPAGTTVYFRFYINDGHHTNPSEYPTTTSYSYFKSYCSFYVQ